MIGAARIGDVGAIRRIAWMRIEVVGHWSRGRSPVRGGQTQTTTVKAP